LTVAKNLLLEALPVAEQRALDPHLKHVECKQDELLFDIHEPIRDIYFPLDGVVSLVLPLLTGETIETAMVGRDGVIGAAAALNGRLSLSRAVVQIGGAFLRNPANTLKTLVQEHAQLRSLLGAHEQALFAQAQQAAACNATHVVESRLAKWLLRAADLRDSDELPLTQEYIAHMLGVRRTSVTMVARTLQQAGLIRYSRGKIKLLDVAGLKETACECYETVKMNYQALLHPSN
jgi:CRP-like cAMP-binding protein